MSDLRDLYQELIIDHGRHPRNFGKLDNANYIKEGFNPLCGDKLTLYLQVENELIIAASFEGQGCAISMASASLMTEAIINHSVTDAEKLFEQFHDLVTGKLDAESAELGKLLALTGVSEFPARVKCATLSWHTLMGALSQKDGDITTE